MNRRDFLYQTGMTAAGLALFDHARLFGQGETTERWRIFEITTRVEVLQPRGATRVWLPTPLAVAPYQKTMGDTYHPGGGTAVMIETNANEPDILGTIAGDDTIMIITSGALQSRAVVRRLLALAGSREDDPIRAAEPPTTTSQSRPTTTSPTRPVVIQTKKPTKETP